jgi:lipopolysaccharide export system protein LptC
LVLPRLAADNPPRSSSPSPIINFRLPTFTNAGYREWLVRGSEALPGSHNDLQVKELTLTIFSGDEADRIDTMILSPAAHIFATDQVATGDSTIRVINDQFEASGSQWRYSHKEKMISIKKNVRVSFKAELKNLLQ